MLSLILWKRVTNVFIAWHHRTMLMNFIIHQRQSFEGIYLHSASSHELSIPRIRLLTYIDWAFPVAAVRIWNSLPQHITSAPSLPVFCSRLKTYFFELLLPVITFAHEVTLSLMDTLITLTYLLTYPISLQHTDYILYSQSLSQFYTWRLVVNNIHHTPDPSYHLSALLHTRQCKDTMMTCTVKYIHNYKTNSVDQKLWTMMTLSNLQSELWPPVTLTFDILTPKLTVSWSCPVDHLCHFAAKSVQPFCNYCVPKFDPFWPPVTLTFDLSTPKLTISCPCNADHLCHFASKLVHLFSK